MTTTPAPAATVLGITDEVETCECCGRTGLRRVVAIALDETRTPTYYGTTCAARILGTSTADVEATAAEADTRREAKAARLARWEAALALYDPANPAAVMDDQETDFNRLRREYGRGDASLFPPAAFAAFAAGVVDGLRIDLALLAPV